MGYCTCAYVNLESSEDVSLSTDVSGLYTRTMSRHSVDTRSCVLHRRTDMQDREAPLPTFHTGKLPPEFLQHLSSKTHEDRDTYWHEVQLSNIKLRQTRKGNPFCRARAFQWQDLELPM